MAYIDIARFILIYGERETLQLTDRENIQVVNAPVFDAAAIKADAIINDTLNQIYTVPFVSPIPEVILKIAEILTRCELYTLNDNKATEKQCAMAMKMLERVKTGGIVLTGLVPLQPVNDFVNIELTRV